jgi:squalene-hopene/tetraprenyl-beta-curcumene cyclase
MFRAQRWLFPLISLVGIALHGSIVADEQSLQKYTPPGESKKDEPIAKEYSATKAASFLDSAALDWWKQQNCFSCHSTYVYLYARPMISANVRAHRDIRQALEQIVSKTWVEDKPRWDTEIVTAAAALAYNDMLTTKKLHPLTKTALDRMWTVQRKDGGWNWIKCNWPPMEYDDHYGVTLAALAVGVAPEGYARTDAAQQGLNRIRSYLKAHPPQNLHHQAMLLWVATHLDGFVSPDERKETMKHLLAKQLPDGGWSAASLGHWNKRADKLPQDLTTSDGYGTGFTIFVLRRGGMSAEEPALRKGIAWLKANQRESGRWFTRSLNKDNKHYLTHIGSAFAVMAIASCEP